MLEDNFRRALRLSHGDPMVFLQQPISLGLLLAALALWRSSSSGHTPDPETGVSGGLPTIKGVSLPPAPSGRCGAQAGATTVVAVAQQDAARATCRRLARVNPMHRLPPDTPKERTGRNAYAGLGRSSDAIMRR